MALPLWPPPQAPAGDEVGRRHSHFPFRTCRHRSCRSGTGTFPASETWRLLFELSLKSHPVLWIHVQGRRLSQAGNRTRPSAALHNAECLNKNKRNFTENLTQFGLNQHWGLTDVHLHHFSPLFLSSTTMTKLLCFLIEPQKPPSTKRTHTHTHTRAHTHAHTR